VRDQRVGDLQQETGRQGLVGDDEAFGAVPGVQCVEVGRNLLGTAAPVRTRRDPVDRRDVAELAAVEVSTPCP